jgi:isoleucyl-tRNA synthetase
LRKDSGYEVTDKILVQIMDHPEISAAITEHKSYIGVQTLAKTIELVANLEQNTAKLVELDDSITTYIRIVKV